MRTRRLGALALLWLLAHALLWLQIAPVVDAAAMLLIAVYLPGQLLADLLLRRVPVGQIERFVHGLGAGFGLLVVGMLLLSYLPGPLPRTVPLLLSNGLILLLGVASWKHAPEVRADSAALWWAAAAVLVVAAMLRLPNLGYAEFHGDEARAVLRAAAVMQGYEDVLFLHRKGPVEILIPAAQFAYGGTIDEAAARLPFAVASLGALVTLLLIGYRLFGLPAGLAAALLLTLDGYSVAFGRFVQYQSVVMLVAALSVLLMIRLYQEVRHAGRILVLLALLLACGLLAHWDALAAFVPVLFLWLALGVRRRMKWGALLGATAPAALLGVGLVALYYAPLLAHPAAASTFSYLRSERIGSGAPYNNLPDFLLRGALYSSVWLLGLMLLLLAVAAVMALWRARRMTAPEWAVWLWLLVPAAGYLFLVATPRTHVHVFYAPWALVAGSAIGAGWEWLRVRAIRPLPAFAAGGATLLYLFLAGHPYLTYVYHRQEVVREGTEWVRRLYPQPGQSAAVDGRFGFPLANGWKIVGTSYAEAKIAGDFDTNQRYAWTPAWYTRGQRRCAATAEWYFAVDALEPWAESKEAVEDRVRAQGFAPVAESSLGGRAKMILYHVGEVAEPAALLLEDYAPRFDASAGFDLPLDYPVIIPPMKQAIGANLGGEVVLEGFTLERPVSLRPGDSVRLQLFWRALRPIETAYKVFNQAYDSAGRMAAQRDGSPVCDQEPTPTWAPGEIIVDAYELTIAPDTPAGSYPLVTGMYDEATGARLPVLDGAGAAIDDKITLATLVIAGE